MKAVVTGLSRGSAYSSLMHRTFEVKEIVSGNRIALNVNGRTVDFVTSEITIVDYEKELQCSEGIVKERLIEYGQIKEIDSL